MGWLPSAAGRYPHRPANTTRRRGGWFVSSSENWYAATNEFMSDRLESRIRLGRQRGENPGVCNAYHVAPAREIARI